MVPVLPAVLLKVSFDGYLTDSWITSARHLAKGSGIDVAQRVLELRVIEHIEKLGPEFGSNPLVDLGHFVQRNVPVIQARSAEKSPA